MVTGLGCCIGVGCWPKPSRERCHALQRGPQRDEQPLRRFREERERLCGCQRLLALPLLLSALR